MHSFAGMQIVVNTRLLLPNRLDGMGWFSYQALKRITRSNPGVHFIFIFDRAYDESFVFGDNVTPMILGPQARHPVLYYVWLQHSVKPMLDRMKPDLFLSPDGFLCLGTKVKQLPVIHDLNFLHHPRDTRWLTSKYYNHFFPRFARAATRIATVSEYSKKDIVDSFGISPGKIDVVYNGVNEFFRPSDDFAQQKARKKFAYGKPYFLCVGSLHPRKNIVRLIRAFDQFKAGQQNDVKLVFAGRGMWGQKEIQKTVEKSASRNDIIFTERLNNEDLSQVTAGALALTYVPYYEGFGIPVIEAMAAGVPVITSNITSLPEVAGDAAILVDPMKEGEISDAMARIWKQPSLRDELTGKGLVRHRQFTWDRTAELLWNSVKRAVEGD